VHYLQELGVYGHALADNVQGKHVTVNALAGHGIRVRHLMSGSGSLSR
jgi:hypothetical protein